ncbi:MAG: NAD(+) diphosphatase [Rubrivivax sp.]|jgi:NAD+ diphosphatase|nr:NAD(+) diphosphatase [Rubrivivax sp.]MBK8526344.1 NAD(+) diphosphatase [Rubrivivax sp.]
MIFVPAIDPAAVPSTTHWCLAFVDGMLLLPEPEDLCLCALAEAAWQQVAPMAQVRHYLGQLDGLDCWALRLPAAPPGWRSVPLRSAMMGLPETLAGVAGRAAQVLEWDRAHRFCGACGTPTEARHGERARRCPACGLTVYPRINPAMMTLVWRPGQLLLARGPHFAPHMYSALAGFVEAGESIEQCIRREVTEEVGVQVAGLRYYGSQSWPFPNSLMIAFTAEWLAGDIVRQPDEIEDAQWFDIAALPQIPPRFSISGHLIRDTVAAMQAVG